MPNADIYTVATAHLDTSWHWPLERTIAEFLPATLRENLALMEQYPQYSFSFEGAYRYALAQMYHPALFEQMQQAIADGRWRTAGSAWENGDVNIPSPEALLRNFLLGNLYFEETFGKRSCDVYLPDCFGFGAALPGIAAHANLKGFTTQKLMWGAAGKVPFALGRWQGPDGSEIFACPDAQNYAAQLKKIRKSHVMRRALHHAKRRKMLPAAMRLYGVGDQGGAPQEASLQVLQSEMEQNGEKHLAKVHSAGSDDIFRALQALPAAQRARLPVYRGEWLLSVHGTGCYTARALSKRWNRKAEQLAQAAEAACCFAGFLGDESYPAQTLDEAWKRVIAHQFHDDITGTSDEISYLRNWDDLMVSQQQFAGAYIQGISAVTGCMDTGFAIGRCLAVSNVTGWERRESVQVRLPQALKSSTVRVYDSEGFELPVQLLKDKETVVFSAVLPPLSVSLFDIQLSAIPCGLDAGLHLREHEQGISLENHLLRIEIDSNGDIASLYDKRQCREQLYAPVRLGLYKCDGSPRWPAWELHYPELKRRPEYLRKPVIEILERGPARLAVKVTREARGSVFAQTISLDAAGEWLRVHNEVDWQSLRTLLKAEIPMAAENKQAAYDLGFGAALRGESSARQYEVPAQQWAAITDRSEPFGMAVLSDCKTGWDHPDRRTLRLTGIFSPRSGCRGNAHLLDFGRNTFDFGLFPCQESSYEEFCRAGACFNQPLAGFWPADAPVKTTQRRAAKTPKGLGPFLIKEADLRQLRFGGLGQGMVLRALKKAQRSDAWVLRVQEANGVPLADGSVSLGGGILAFEEIYGSEEPRAIVNYACLRGGTLHIALNPFEIRSFLLQVKPMEHAAPSANITSVPLPQEPSSLLPEQQPLTICRGQCIDLPQGRQLHLAAASLEGDRTGVEFRVGDAAYTRTVYSARQAVAAGDLPGLGVGGYVKKAWPVQAFTPLYGEDGQAIAGASARFYDITLPIQAGASQLTLPDDASIAIVSAAVHARPSAQPACELFDVLPRRPDSEPYALTRKQQKAKDSPMRLRKLQGKLRFAAGYLRLRKQVDW